MMRVLQAEWKFFIVLLLVMAAVAAFYYEYRQDNAKRQAGNTAQPEIIINTQGDSGSLGEERVVYIQGGQTHTKEVVYLPREIEARTGQPKEINIEFKNTVNKVYVKVNESECAVPAEMDEAGRLEKDKLVLTEKTELRTVITAPKPALYVGLGWSREGPAAQINGPLYKNISWWVYGDKKNIAGGIQFPVNR